MEIQPREPLYLIHQAKLKFWEITNVGNINQVRYGKLKEGVEYKTESASQSYTNTEEALNRAKELARLKITKGYGSSTNRLALRSPVVTPIKNRFTEKIPNINQFKGAYLEIDNGNFRAFLKVQLNGELTFRYEYQDRIS